MGTHGTSLSKKNYLNDMNAPYSKVVTSLENFKKHKIILSANESILDSPEKKKTLKTVHNENTELAETKSITSDENYEYRPSNNHIRYADNLSHRIQFFNQDLNKTMVSLRQFIVTKDDRIRILEEENNKLKSLLAKAGISLEEEL